MTFLNLQNVSAGQDADSGPETTRSLPPAMSHDHHARSLKHLLDSLVRWTPNPFAPMDSGNMMLLHFDGLGEYVPGTASQDFVML